MHLIALYDLDPLVERATLGGHPLVRINALAFSGNGLSLGALPTTTLTLTSGGVLSTGGSNTLNVPVIALAAKNGVFHVDSGASLSVGSMITGTAGITKADAGSMTLTAPQYFTGGLFVNAGTLTALSGSPYALSAAPIAITVAPNNAFLYISTLGGIFVYNINTSTGQLTIGNSG